MAEEKWEDVKGSSNLWLPTKVGEAIEGAIVAMEKNQYGIQAKIELKDGQQLLTPSHKVLQSRLADCKVGDYVRITFEKEELPTVKGRQGTKIYKIARKVIEVQQEKI